MKPHTLAPSTLATSLLPAAVVLALVGCGGGQGSTPPTSTADPTSTPTTRAAVASPTDTASSSAAGSSTPEAGATPRTQALQDLVDQGYGLSDDWVVETVLSDLDSATGGLAIAPDGTLYQADFGYTGHPGNRVYRISPAGEVEDFAMSDDFANLTMTTFGPDGSLYQASYGTDSVFRLEPDGTPVLLADGILGATGIVVMDDGSLLVEAYDANRIHRVTPDGEVEEWATFAGFDGPNGLTIDPEGVVYAVNHRDGGLFSITPDGTVTRLLTFPEPTSHVVWRDGALYVTSRGAYVVYRHDLATGATDIIAGNGEPGDRDGRGTAASFGRPNAIALGPDGALWINHGGDGVNQPLTIRRLVHDPR